MHAEVLGWVGQFRTDEDLSVLDVGGRDLNGSTRSLFPNASPYHVLDLRPGPNVDIVADAAAWEPVFSDGVPSAGYDLVLTTETFEHAENWRGIIATAWKALRPGGWLIFTCAGPGRPAHSGVEAVQSLIGDEWYANVSPQEIRAVLEEQGWTEIETHLRGLDTQGKAVKPEGVTGGQLIAAASQVAPETGGREVFLSAALTRTAGSPDNA